MLIIIFSTQVCLTSVLETKSENNRQNVSIQSKLRNAWLLFEEKGSGFFPSFACVIIKSRRLSSLSFIKKRTLVN